MDCDHRDPKAPDPADPVEEDILPRERETDADKRKKGDSDARKDRESGRDLA